ncbi:MAG: zf-HC2 domain-containing protein [Actinomycetales bacterium]|nr:MAG: zf-HC2 domain-containing protein [Actinomycetales bacterium]
MRESLGAFVLGHLDPIETARVRAHLDGCAACRAEHEALAPLALALRDVDPDFLEESPEPGALLGARIEATIGTERTRRRRRAAVQRTLVGTAAGLVLVATFLAGGRVAGDDAPKAAPLETVAVSSTSSGVSADAGLVDHTWGLEIKLNATGLEDGESYTATVESAGREYPAGEFVGVTDVEIHCNMSTSVLRDEASGFTVWDSDGRPVLHAEL